MDSLNSYTLVHQSTVSNNHFINLLITYIKYIKHIKPNISVDELIDTVIEAFDDELMYLLPHRMND